MSEQRLIDANAADVERICCYYGDCCRIEDVQEWLDEQPTIDAVPVVHARWVRKDETQVMFDVEWQCSKCGCEISTTGIYTPMVAGWHFCPNCGAKMDGGVK